MNRTNYFCQTLQHLRHYEEVLLFANLHFFTDDEQQEAVHYLAKEYDGEAVTYPYKAPAFDEAAALWAAKTVYLSVQLLLYRENKETHLETLLPSYQNELTASAVLSADLVLRFLPDIILQLKAIDPDDKLIAVLEMHLKTWHYSAVGCALPADELAFETITTSPCLFQLYVDRVIAHKALSLAAHPAIAHGVSAALGLYAPQLWSQFKQEETT